MIYVCPAKCGVLLLFKSQQPFNAMKESTQSPALMSEEQLKAFIAKVQGDKSLQDQLNAEGADVVAIAKAAGFSITSEDLQEHRQDLSDDELESVAGGNLEDLYTYIAC